MRFETIAGCIRASGLSRVSGKNARLPGAARPAGVTRMLDACTRLGDDYDRTMKCRSSGEANAAETDPQFVRIKR
ncbi:hypothetical protein [Burkholderia sp. Bp8963]|uniref:hypothetical protein n=1 Tax=Burkholderia sp. Bp8963 TaxID=2184547 RepID=UPI000F5A7B46|nr:hypothetical protein [Burkholderia sp. Bp8963]